VPAVPAVRLAAGASVAAKSAWAGLAAGFLHTLCGPDHLAVSATLCLTAGACQGSSRLSGQSGCTAEQLQ
jgi:hydrogenase/urease accessory protein HupE